jgi:predicted PurR-regulated permease PerM
MDSFVDRPGLSYRAVFLAAGLYVFISNFTLFSPILLTFFLILLITLSLNPMVVALRRFIRRTVAAILIALAFLIVIAAAGWALYSPLKEPFVRLFHRFPVYCQNIGTLLHHYEQSFTPTTPEAPAPPVSPAQGFHIDLQQVVTKLGSGVHEIISNTAVMVLVAITVFVGVAYMLQNPRPVFASFFGLVPERHQPAAARIARRVARFVPRWALALICGMATIGLLVFFAMWPVLGVENAAMMGFIAFVFEAVPYVGAIVAGVPALLLALGMGGSKPFWVILAYVIIQLAEHNVINPLIVAGPLSQHPVSVIFAVMLCLAGFGFLGVLLAVPMVETISIVYDELYRPCYLPHTTSKDLDRMALEMLQGDPDAPPPHDSGEPLDLAHPEKTRA